MNRQGGFFIYAEKENKIYPTKPLRCLILFRRRGFYKIFFKYLIQERARFNFIRTALLRGSIKVVFISPLKGERPFSAILT